MGPTIETLNELAAAWSGSMLRATWQGGLAIAAAWVLVRCRPGLPPRVACWVWRLADLKLIVALLWATPLLLPLLPPSHATAAASSDDRRVRNFRRARPADRSGSRTRPAKPHADPGASSAESRVRGARALAGRGRRRGGSGGKGGDRRRPSAAVLSADQLPRFARRRRRPGPHPRSAERPRGEGRAGRGPADARRRVPPGDPAARSDALRPSIDERSGRSWPMSWPTSAVATSCGAAWRGWCRAVFFFHPLVWLAHREALLAREAACDALAIAGFGRAALGIRPNPAGDRSRGPGAARALGGNPWHGRLGRLSQTEAHGDENNPATIPTTAPVLGLRPPGDRRRRGHPLATRSPRRPAPRSRSQFKPPEPNRRSEPKNRHAFSTSWGRTLPGT